MKDNILFDLKLENIPLINLRFEFKNNYNLLLANNFRNQFIETDRPIETPYIIWLGRKDDFLTFLIQRAVLGIESYLPGVVFYEAGIRGLLFKKENSGVTKNPFKLGGRSTVENYYNKLPSIVDPKYSLKNYDIKLWEATKQFYSEIRNPIFHGKEVKDKNIEGVLKVFKHIAAMYQWIDTWHPLENLWPGDGSKLNMKLKVTPEDDFH